MARKVSWQATSVPTLARDVAASDRRVVGYFRLLRAHNPELMQALSGPEPDDDPTVWLERRILSMETATYYWITRPMSEVALDASQDVPLLEAESAPDLDGFMCFEQPLPPVEVRSTDEQLTLLRNVGDPISDLGPIPIDAISWHIFGDRLTVSLMARAHRIPNELPELCTRELSPLSEFYAKMPVNLEAGVNEPDGEISFDPQHIGPLAWLAAAWVLMQEPRVATTRQLDSDWGGPVTPRTKPHSMVTTVSLRPMRTVTVREDSEPTGRKLTHRHIVRGHWTHQPHGPNNSLRRLQWRETYLKGPEGAPILDRDMVRVWRR